jgi:hypothetical protein
VVAQPVGLDHQPEVGPIEVHAEAVDHLPGEGEPSFPRDRDESPLQFRVSEGEGVTVEETAQDPDAGSPPDLIQTAANLLRGCELEPARTRARPLSRDRVGSAQGGRPHRPRGESDAAALSRCAVRSPRGETEVEQLPARDDAVLSSHQLPDERLDGCARYSGHKAPLDDRARCKGAVACRDACASRVTQSRPAGRVRVVT